MSQWTPALDTTDQSHWDDEGVALFVEHVSKEFSGSVGILAKVATTNDNITMQRKAMAMFFRDKLPGGEVALQHLDDQQSFSLDLLNQPKPFTLEQWEDAMLIEAEKILRDVKPADYERIAQASGETITEARKRIWAKAFNACKYKTWRPGARNVV